MILNGLSGSPVTDAANGKSGAWKSLRAPGASTGNAQRIGNAREPDRASTRHDGASAAEKNAPDREDGGPVRFGAAGLPVFPAQGSEKAGAVESSRPHMDVTQGSAGSHSAQADGTGEDMAQRAGRMKYLVDAMRNASSQSQQAAQDGAEKAATDQFRQAMAAYGDNSG